MKMYENKYFDFVSDDNKSRINDIITHVRKNTPSFVINNNSNSNRTENKIQFLIPLGDCSDDYELINLIVDKYDIEILEPNMNDLSASEIAKIIHELLSHKTDEYSIMFDLIIEELLEGKDNIYNAYLTIFNSDGGEIIFEAKLPYINENILNFMNDYSKFFM